MKKFNLIICFAFSVLGTANGQMKNGNVYLGGQFGLTFSTQSGSSASYSIVPSIGVMVSDRISLDFLLGYSSRMELLGSYFGRLSTFSVGAGATYYFKMSEQFAFTTGGSLSFAHSTFERNNVYYYYNSYDTDNNLFYFNVSPGAIFFPHRRFSISTNLGSFLGITYSIEEKAAIVQFLNISTLRPTIGAAFWF